MKLRREYLIAVGVLLVLLMITIAAGLFQGKTEEIPALSSNSNTETGARALRLWLTAAGHQVSNSSSQLYKVPEGTDVVLILEPTIMDGISSAEWKTLDKWLEKGGTLFLASRQIWRPLSSSSLNVDVNFVGVHEYPVLPAAPIFRAPPIVQPAKLTLQYTLKTRDGQGQPLLSTEDGPVGLRLNRQNGLVILVSDSSFLTNQGLKDPGNANLALNLFSMLPNGSKIWIDEWHHGDRGSAGVQEYGPEAWLTSTPAGFALLFSAGVIFLGLLLAGRPFGRPVPLPQEQQRRSALEYVTALANLNRRAGHRKALMQYYHTTLKRAYGRRYRLDPSLPDPDYMDQLAHYNPALDAPALLNLLQRLAQKSFSEVQVVQLAREASDWLSTLERHGLQ